MCYELHRKNGGRILCQLIESITDWVMRRILTYLVSEVNYKAILYLGDCP